MPAGPQTWCSSRASTSLGGVQTRLEQLWPGLFESGLHPMPPVGGRSAMAQRLTNTCRGPGCGPGTGLTHALGAMTSGSREEPTSWRLNRQPSPSNAPPSQRLDIRSANPPSRQTIRQAQTPSAHRSAAGPQRRVQMAHTSNIELACSSPPQLRSTPCGRARLARSLIDVVPSWLSQSQALVDRLA